MDLLVCLSFTSCQTDWGYWDSAATTSNPAVVSRVKLGSFVQGRDNRDLPSFAEDKTAQRGV